MCIAEIAARKTFYRDAFEAGVITGQEYQAFIEAINALVVNKAKREA
jgi:hypothetical protein